MVIRMDYLHSSLHYAPFAKSGLSGKTTLNHNQNFAPFLSTYTEVNNDDMSILGLYGYPDGLPTGKFVSEYSNVSTV